MTAVSLVFAGLVLGVCVLGFVAARWGGGSLATLEGWALGGRGFGTVVSWFLMGGDLYTAYTFIAVPALVYGVGALGFFAVPYATVTYPIAFIVLARFWSVARNRGYLTASDFVRDRYGSRALELATALTAVVATLPYIALQLVGMRAVFLQLGGAFASQNGVLALTVSFALLAAITYTSGLRAPAAIAFVKDTLIYVTVIAAIAVIPAKLGGWMHVFSASSAVLATRTKPSGILLPHGAYFAYASMILGSSLAQCTYPHLITGALASKSRGVIRRNMALLPIYTLLLGLLALLGYCALAAGIASKDSSLIVPLLFARYFPGWFAGVAYAAIVIGAIVPAAVMAIGGSNVFVSNVAGEFHRERTPAATRLTKNVTLAICALALLFILFVPVPFAIDFQLLGGAIMIQVFPAFAVGLFTRWFDPRALLAGWGAGIAAALAMAVESGFSSNITLHAGGASLTGFIAFFAFFLNLGVATIGTAALRAGGSSIPTDHTSLGDYA